MGYFDGNSMESFFKNDYVKVTKADFIGKPINSIELYRDSKLNLIVTVKYSGMPANKEMGYRPGTVFQANNEIEIEYIGGATGKIIGGVPQSTASNGIFGKNIETTEIYSAQSVELNFSSEAAAHYVVEWVDNISSNFIWFEPTRKKIHEEYTHVLGSGDAEIVMKSSSEEGGGASAIHLRVAEVDFYVLRSNVKEGDRQGKIVYKGCPNQEFRDKVRNCLSFVLGIPIIYLGHTEYTKDWYPKLIRSVDGMSIGGAMFEMHDAPPYPIAQQGSRNMMDQNAVGIIVNNLYENYDRMSFGTLIWSYWYAMCAPLHTAAVHFGGIIETLQKNPIIPLGAKRNKLLENEVWRGLQKAVKDYLSTQSIPEDVRPILNSKISSINQTPQNLTLKRVLEVMGLRIGDLELRAWKDRNITAHGGILDKPIDAILHAKVLRILFHRMLAGATYCSDRYIDYYSLDFPTRSLPEAIPVRES